MSTATWSRAPRAQALLSESRMLFCSEMNHGVERRTMTNDINNNPPLPQTTWITAEINSVLHMMTSIPLQDLSFSLIVCLKLHLYYLQLVCCTTIPWFGPSHCTLNWYAPLYSVVWLSLLPLVAAASHICTSACDEGAWFSEICPSFANTWGSWPFSDWKPIKSHK